VLHRTHILILSQQIARYLINHERNSIHDIILHFTRTVHKLLPELIRDALIVLLHHNCVDVCIPPVDEDDENVSPATVEIEYRLNVEAVVSRLRFSHMITCASKNLGPLESDIMEELVLFGRMTVGQLLDRMEKKIAKSTVHGAENITEEDVKSAFESLIKRRYVVSTPTIETQLGRLLAHATSSAAAAAAAAEAKSAASRKRKLMDGTDVSVGSAASAPVSTLSQPITKRAATDRNSRANSSAPSELLPLELRLMQQRGETMGTMPGETSGAESHQPPPAPAAGASSGRGGGRGGRGRGRGGRGRGAAQPATGAAETTASAAVEEATAFGSEERPKVTNSFVVSDSFTFCCTCVLY
jgi:hypothetical protein